MFKLRWASLGVTAAMVLLMVSAAIAEVDDPMRPAVETPQAASEEAVSDWTLNSVLISERRKLAVINGQVLRQGETVDGARVVSIDPSQVVIRHAGGQETLSLKSELGISRSRGQ